jgi:hypothetical protein
MYLPQKLRLKLLSQFEKLVVEGQAIHKDIRTIPGAWKEPIVRSSEPYQEPNRHEVDWPRFVAWRTRVISLLTQVLLHSAAHADTVQTLKSLSNTKSHLEYGIALLQGIRADFEDGFLDDLAQKIESGIAESYLDQAAILLNETPEPVSHIPAAVLAGAVLEKTLRAICSSAQPVINTIGPDGKPFTLNRLIDEIKKAEIISELRAKELRFFADVRNKAAHGEFSSFSRRDVEKLLKGVSEFVAQTST